MQTTPALLLALASALTVSGQIVESDTDYKPEVVKVVRECPVFKGHILKAYAQSGALFITVDRAATDAITLSNCDMQRDTVAAIANKWVDLIGKERFLWVQVRSYTGRDIMKIAKTFFGGLKYHCE